MYAKHRGSSVYHARVADFCQLAASKGNVHDSQPLITRLTRQVERFSLDTVAVGVDAGYFTSAVCHLTQEMGVALVPGYRRPHKGQNDYQKKHFRYDPAQELYICPAGSELSYGTTDRNGYRHYRSDKAVCAGCPERSKCTKNRQMQKTITRHVWEEAKEKANALRLTKWGKKVYARRKETVERSFADAKQHHGHRYARFRGLMKVQMQCLLAATAHLCWFFSMTGALIRGYIARRLLLKALAR